MIALNEEGWYCIWEDPYVDTELEWPSYDELVECKISGGGPAVHFFGRFVKQRSHPGSGHSMGEGWINEETGFPEDDVTHWRPLPAINDTYKIF